MRQITERGYPVAEVSQRPGVSQQSLYEWKKKLAVWNAKGNDEAEEIGRLKKDLIRVTEEQDTPKSGRVFRQGCKMRYAFIALHRLQFLCERRAAFYRFIRADSMLGSRTR